MKYISDLQKKSEKSDANQRRVGRVSDGNSFDIGIYAVLEYLR
jgi:hypothetical protein